MTSIYPSSSTTSSASSTSSANLLRISGMASGVDTDSVVKSMVSSYQSKIDKANQAKQTLQWKQEAYRNIIKDVKGLQDYFDPISSKYILGGSTLNINKASSDTASVASATVDSTAKAGTYNINVTKLAEQAKIQGEAKDSLIKLSSFTDNSSQTLTNNSGKTVSLSGLTSTTGSDLAAEINSKIAASDLKGQVSASYVNETVDGTTTEYIKFTKISSDSSTTIKYSDSATYAAGVDVNSGISGPSKLMSDLKFSTGSIKFTLNNGTTSSTVSLTVDSSTTLQNLIDKVNSATSGAVTLNIDDTTGRISFKSKSYGSASNITITNNSTDNNIIDELKLSSPTAGKDAIVAITAPGETSATITTQSSNKFTVNGVSYNVVKAASANITVTANSDDVVTNMKSFIKDYNSVISEINTKLTEKKNSDYAPLTDSQKESMSESQITAWETKAKVGILRNDDQLNSLMTQLRGTFNSAVYSSYSSTNTTDGKVPLAFGQYGTNAIGIDTSTDTTDGGKLVLKDETKLKDAIENHFEDFKKFFIGTSDSTLGTNQAYIGSKKYYENGIFTRMDNILRDYVAAPGIGEDGTYSLSGSMNIFVNKQYDYTSSGSSSKNTLPDQVYSKTVSITKYTTQLKDAQTRYYAKFTALETAMSKLNAQQSSLSSMLGTN